MEKRKAISVPQVGLIKDIYEIGDVVEHRCA